MELEELKKSWNALDEHLKDKKLVRDEDITQIINRAKTKINEMSRFNQRLRLLSLLAIALIALFLFYDGVFPDIYYQIIFVALFPALAWDVFTSRFLSQTKIDEMPLVTVISRFNRIHRWVIRERIIGIGFMLCMAGFFFIHRQVWQAGTGVMIFFFAIWAICFTIPLWVYRKNLGRLKEIKKNLDELKELNQEDSLES